MSMSKYDKGKLSSLHPRTLIIKKFILPNRITVLMKIYPQSRPCFEESNTHLMISSSLILFWPSINVSFAYCKLLKFKSKEPGKLVRKPAFFDVLIMLLNSSGTSTNKRGGRKSSCLKPFLQTISLPGVPFTRNCVLAEFNHWLIHLNHLSPKPM